MHGLVSKDGFARKHYLSHSSVDLLIEMSKLEIIEVQGYLTSTSYDTIVSNSIAEHLRKHLQKLE